MIRKAHLAKLMDEGRYDDVRADLSRRPVSTLPFPAEASDADIHSIEPLKPTAPATSPASSAMESSMPVPIFTWVLRTGSPASLASCPNDTLSSMCTQASAISSLHRNSRSGLPLRSSIPTSHTPLPKSPV